MAVEETKKTEVEAVTSTNSQQQEPEKKAEAISTPSTSTPATSSIDSKTMIILTHLLGILTSFIGPLVILLVSNDELVKKHSRSALNFQISIAIYFFVAGILSLVLIGILLIPIIGILAVVFPILATLKANENINEVYKYPLTIPIIPIENK